MKRKYDKHRRESVQYNVGDWVLLDSFHISSERPNKKLEDKRYGPFQIQAKVGSGAYRLKLPPQWKAIHPVFNEALMSPAHQPTFPNQPKLVADVPAVTDSLPQPEEILDSKVMRGALRYLVKWKDKPRSENTWEKRSDLLKTSRPLIDAFHAKNPTAPRMPTITIAPRSRLVEVMDPDQRCWDYWTRKWDKWQLIRTKTYWTLGVVADTES